MITAQNELEKFIDRKGALFADACMNLAKAKAEGSIAHNRALDDMAMLIGRTLALTDLHGRKRTLMEADHASSTARFAEIPHDANPLGNLPFEEAVDDIITREPRLAKSWQEVSRLYSSDHVFAMARSADQKVTERV